MKIWLICAMILSITIFCIAFSRQANDLDKGNECRFIEESLKDINQIKIGMTRDDLHKIFKEEGGISSRTQKRFVYGKCRYIKIDVKFEPVGGIETNTNESYDDKIIEISKPYLEYTIVD